MYVLPHGLYNFTTVLHGHLLISSSINCVFFVKHYCPFCYVIMCAVYTFCNKMLDILIFIIVILICLLKNSSVWSILTCSIA